MIPFNKPYITGKETQYILEAVQSGKISGDGMFTKKVHQFFEDRYGFQKVLMTTSCTDALEMAAILINIQPGDEVIMPSYTFVSTANAFALRGAKIVFCDSRDDHPGMDESQIESLITSKTKAIVPVHYAGVACDMDRIMKLADAYNLFVIEDAAQAIDSYYTFPDGTKKPLGGIGHLGAFSFHETKNIQCGEGGLLIINDPQFNLRAEIIREKGTNRSAFFRGEADKYGWVDIGSSFLPSELNAAFLYAQLEVLDQIQDKRKEIWGAYQISLSALPVKVGIQLPIIPKYATNNAHMFYLICNNPEQRSNLIDYLKSKSILSVFHYQSLHLSKCYLKQNSPSSLPNTERCSDNLIRLPLYFELTTDQQKFIIKSILDFHLND
jgi:dTDP-4-amino-4,6-dideoxygalactose transaminase